MLSTEEAKGNRAPGILGFGLDYKYADRYPGGLAGLCDRYRARLSHLSIVSLQSCEQARHFKQIARDLPVIHHLSEVAPADPEGPDLELLARQDAISQELGAAWCGEDIGIWSLGPYSIPYFVPPLFEAEVAERVSEGILKVAERSSVTFLAEIPSCSFIAGRLSLGEFFHRLVEQSACPIVLDLSHVYSYGLVSGQSPSAVLRSLPLSSAQEIHVAGGRVNPNHPFRYIDTHSDPIMDGVMDLLVEAVSSCPNLRGVTYEIGMRLPAETLEADFGRIERTLRAANFTPALDRQPPRLNAEATAHERRS